MSRKMICRILSSRGLAMYLIAYVLLLITTGRASVVDILGGFSPERSFGLNVLGIMRWNLGVLPPVIIGILFMSSELGKLSCYTVIRSKSINRWFLLRYTCIVLADVVYLLFFVIITTVFGYNAGCGIKGICLFMLVFSVHTILISTLSVSLLAVFKSHRIALLSFFIVEGVMPAVGSVFPSASKYLLPFWGMANDEELISLNKIFYLSATVVISILLSVLLVIAVLKRLRVNNPAANSQNI